MGTIGAVRSTTARKCLFVSFCCLIGVSNVYAVTIDRAVWRAGSEQLILKGQDLAQSEIVLVDASSGLPLATVKASRSGNWSKSLDAVSSIPCRVRAISPTGQARANVANAPGDCGAPTLVMDRAVWKPSSGRLVVFGYADTLNTVFLTDALTGEELGSAKAGDDGSWRTQIGGLSETPCRVQAKTPRERKSTPTFGTRPHLAARHRFCRSSQLRFSPKSNAMFAMDTMVPVSPVQILPGSPDQRLPGLSIKRKCMPESPRPAKRLRYLPPF